MSNLLFEGHEWSFEQLEKVYAACDEIAKDIGLDVYPNQFEIVTSEQMLDAYASVGLPINYSHWSYGKDYILNEKAYKQGKRGLAFELVINSSPCINYLMEDNSATIQAVVIAHAAFGHNHFFKNNYLFKKWTDAEGIIDYLVFASEYVSKCEERYGIDAVERILDAAHALSMQGVDKYKRPVSLNAERERERQKAREEYLQKTYDPLKDHFAEKTETQTDKKFPAEPQENVLKFIEKHSPTLEVWERELIRIVRKISQYFYPQIQTKLMNEGFASYIHTYMMNRLYDEGKIGEGSMLEFFEVNSSVLYQGDWDDPYSTGLNPYKLGIEIFKDIERICKEPTEEDREWFPEFAGCGDHWPIILDAVQNYRDESFVKQFLSPKVIRDFKLFTIKDKQSFYEVTEIQDKLGYKEIRNCVAKRYDISLNLPDIQVTKANVNSDRALELTFYPKNGYRLDLNTARICNELVADLWGNRKFEVSLMMET